MYNGTTSTCRSLWNKDDSINVTTTLIPMFCVLFHPWNLNTSFTLSTCTCADGMPTLLLEATGWSWRYHTPCTPKTLVGKCDYHRILGEAYVPWRSTVPHQTYSCAEPLSILMHFGRWLGWIGGRNVNLSHYMYMPCTGERGRDWENEGGNERKEGRGSLQWTDKDTSKSGVLYEANIRFSGHFTALVFLLLYL